MKFPLIFTDYDKRKARHLRARRPEMPDNEIITHIILDIRKEIDLGENRPLKERTEKKGTHRERLRKEASRKEASKPSLTSIEDFAKSVLKGKRPKVEKAKAAVQENPTLSNRALAKIAGVSDHTHQGDATDLVDDDIPISGNLTARVRLPIGIVKISGDSLDRKTLFQSF